MKDGLPGLELALQKPDLLDLEASYAITLAQRSPSQRNC
jgi:hypothetical protein